MAMAAAEKLEMGQRIAQMREARGLKQQEIADYCGVQLRTYQLWQAGDSTPIGDNLRRLAECLAVTPGWLLRGDTPDPFSVREESIVGALERLEVKLDALLEATLDEAALRTMRELVGGVAGDATA